MESDDDDRMVGSREAEARIGQWIAKIIVSVVTAAAIAGPGLYWRLDRAVLTHDAQLKFILERQDGLRQQLRCDPMADPHPICARIERLDLALKRFHRE